MSSFNNDGFNQSSTTGRNDGFSDSRGGVESGTGAGAYDTNKTGSGAYDTTNTGSGAYDTTNTGSGGYGTSQTQQRSSDDQTFQTSDNFDNSPSVGGQTQTQGSGRAFGGDRGAEKPSFTGSDSTYDSTETGGAFAQRSGSGLNQGSGLGQRDEFGDNTSSGVSGTRASGATTSDPYDNSTDNVRDRDQFDSQQGGGRKDESQREHQGGKPSFGDKMRGNVEKIAGTMTGKQDLKERGQERKTGGEF